MRILFASGNPHLPQSFGGVEMNTHQLALALNAKGHETCVLTKLSRADQFGWVREGRTLLTGRSFTVDEDLGYQVYRSRRPPEAIPDLPHFDVAVLSNGHMRDFARELTKRGIPAVAYLNGVTEFADWPVDAVDGPRAEFSDVWCVSEFAADRFEAVCGVRPFVVRPLFEPASYRTQVRGEHVTFINPVPEKGVDLALSVAERCPDIPFVFVKGWPLPFSKRRQLANTLKGLPNVRMIESTFDIREIHRTTRVLMVPTSEIWDETWGRVVSEAQINGIPVIASNHGALPESVGEGGVLLPWNAADEWVSAIRRTFTDEAYHTMLSQAALESAARDEINPALLTDQIEARLHRVARIRGMVDA